MIYLAQVGSFHNVICAIEAAKKNGFNSNNDKIYFLIHRKPLFSKWKHIENILKLRKIKSNEFFFETINERSLNKNLVQRIKKEILFKISHIDVLISQFNFGINHTIIKNIFDIKKLILIDDGLINCLKVKQRFVFLKYLQYKYIGIDYDLNDKLKLGLSKKYDEYFSCLDPNFLCSIKKKTSNICSEVFSFYKKIIKSDQNHFNKIASNNSLLFCSNHAVQSKRIHKNEYFRIIEKHINYMKSNYVVENKYICMHPAEPIDNFNFYKTLGFKNLNKYSAELYLQTNKFNYCIHPCSSVPLVCESLKKTNTKYFGYLLPGMPYKKIGIEVNKKFNFEFLP